MRVEAKTDDADADASGKAGAEIRAKQISNGWYYDTESWA
jgi:hypothetical protein